MLVAFLEFNKYSRKIELIRLKTEIRFERAKAPIYIFFLKLAFINLQILLAYLYSFKLPYTNVD